MHTASYHSNADRNNQPLLCCAKYAARHNLYEQTVTANCWHGSGKQWKGISFPKFSLFSLRSKRSNFACWGVPQAPGQNDAMLVLSNAPYGAASRPADAKKAANAGGFF